MAAFAQHGLLDAIDWNVDAPGTAKPALGEHLELDLGSLHTPSPAVLAHAAAARAEVGAIIDFDLLPGPVVAALPADVDVPAPTAGDHAVLFYDDDAVWLREMVRFVAEGIRAQQPVFLVLTPTMEEALRAELPAEQLAAAERSGSLVISGAQQVLDVVITDGMFDLTAFTEQIVPGIQKLYADHGVFRTSGQAVTLLWESGNVPAALELEHQWNLLQKSIPFTMLCAYPRTLLDERADGVELVTACHSAVLAQ